MARARIDSITRENHERASVHRFVKLLRRAIACVVLGAVTTLSVSWLLALRVQWEALAWVLIV